MTGIYTHTHTHTLHKAILLAADDNDVPMIARNQRDNVTEFTVYHKSKQKQINLQNKTQSPLSTRPQTQPQPHPLPQQLVGACSELLPGHHIDGRK